MSRKHPWRPSVVALALAAAIVVAACTDPRGNVDYFCTTSIGTLPDFRLTGSPYQAVRPGPGGVTIVEVGIAQVQPGAFDFVSWDVLDEFGYNQPPHDEMMFFVEQNPTLGTASTVLKINVYDWTPTGTYGLKVRGLAFQGSFFGGTGVPVGECFRRFELRVLN